MLVNHNWDDIVILNNPNAIWLNLCKVMKQYLEVFMPHKKTSTTGIYTKMVNPSYH